MGVARLTACSSRASNMVARGIAAFALLMGLVASVLAPSAVRAAEPRYFTETRHNVPALFATYWSALGGLQAFGLPITEPFTQNGLTVQYFERARFERHPENRDTPFEVLLGQLGRETRPADPPTIPAGVASARFFPESGHNLVLFRAFWEKNGGIATFGLPLSEELREVNGADGRLYTVQYFERARLEHHPEQRGSEYEVQIGQLGTERYRAIARSNPVAAAAGLPAEPLVVAAAPGASMEQMMWRTINQDRAAAGIAPLALDPLLSKAAAVHVADMIANDFIEHDGTDGSRPIDRIRAAGATVNWASENISMECAKDPAVAVANIRAWMMGEPYSAGNYNHHWNLLYSGYTRLGVAFGVATNGCWIMAEEFGDGVPAPGSLPAGS